MLVKLNCPQCGGLMQVDDGNESVSCPFCGAKIANLRETIEINNNVNVSGTVIHRQDRTNEPNLFISYASTDPKVQMDFSVEGTRIGARFLNGLSQSFHLPAGRHSVILKIGKRYRREIVIPQDNTPVRISAGYNGRAFINIDQPNYTAEEGRPAAGSPANTGAKQSPLGIVAFILALTFFAAPAAVVLAIIDLVKGDKTKKHGLALAGLIIGAVCTLSLIIAIASPKKEEEPTVPPKQTTEREAEDTGKTEQEKTDATEKETEKAATEEATTEEPTEEPTEAPTAEVKDVYEVGDVLMDGGMKIVYAASGEYHSDNEFLQPDEGNKYIFFDFAFINQGKSDDSISSFSFEAYADGYAVDSFYGADDEDLSASLSPGRATRGRVFYEVPADAEEIEVEYTPNYLFSSKKIKFRYEGDKDSGFVLEPNTERTEGAYKVGEVYESKKLKVTYLSCADYGSDNMFVQPRDGYHYISLEFEFENLGTGDETVSSLSFDCYADGISCGATYIRDDDLSVTISAGRKAKGTVTFEVPDQAEVIEAEYSDSLWFSDKVVFTAK